MKKVIAIIGMVFVMAAWAVPSPAEVNLPWDMLDKLLEEPHTWTGDQTFDDTITLKNGSYSATLKQSDAEGLAGADTRLCLDSTLNTFVICEWDNRDTDFGMTAQSHPTLRIENAAGDAFSQLQHANLYLSNGTLAMSYYLGRWQFTGGGTAGVMFEQKTDVPTADMFSIISEANIELDGTTAIEQSWLHLGGKINQSHANAAYNGLSIDMLEINIGDGTAGDGNNFMICSRGGVTPFRIERTGNVHAASGATYFFGSSGAAISHKPGDGELYADDDNGNSTAFSPHKFALFDPDPNEPSPWSFYSRNKYTGEIVNVDMSGLVAAVEDFTGKTFAYRAQQQPHDFEAEQKKQWVNRWIKNNSSVQEVSAVEALKEIDKEVQKTEKKLYEYTDRKGRKKSKWVDVPIVKEVKTKYELVNGAVKEFEEKIYEMKTVKEKVLKGGVRFDEGTGKFYRTVIPTRAEAEQAAETGFVYQLPERLPKWVKDRIKK